MGLGLSTFQLHYIMIVSDPMISKLIGDGVIKEQIRSSSVARISALNTLLHCNSTRMEKLESFYFKNKTIRFYSKNKSTKYANYRFSTLMERYSSLYIEIIDRAYFVLNWSQNRIYVHYNSKSKLNVCKWNKWLFNPFEISFL